tara:strand:- start:6 stop:524 length:519 start_codon:yes stop_codon:yes gene_type:complete
MRFFLPLVFSAFLLVSSCTNKPNDTMLTTLYFIRHAEKDRSNPENKNPHLTTTGLNRAQYWSEIFKNVKFDAIYSTDYNRTIETAKPTANSNNLTIQIYDAIQLDTRNILENNKGNNVLIVGHSDTTPKFVNKFLGTDSYLDIDDSNNGNLYILTITDTMVTDLLLTVNPQQ